MVASPRTLGAIVTFTPLCSYSRTLKSGLVESENMGCSIDPISSLGIASVTSQMKKSCIGWRSGRSGERVDGSLLLDISESCFHTVSRQFRAFTHECQGSCFHPWNRAFRAITRGTGFRVSAHETSCFYTYSFVLLHGRAQKYAFWRKGLRAVRRPVTQTLTIFNTHGVCG